MNRESLDWALKAVIPHAANNYPYLNIETLDGHLYVSATDRYSIGVARTTTDQDVPRVLLPAREAKELRRFIRPGKVAERAETVEMLRVDTSGDGDAELHVAHDSDSAVFTCIRPVDAGMLDVNLAFLLASIQLWWEHAPPRPENGWAASPALLGKFADAQRDDTDRVVLHVAGRNAVVTVGTDFIGAVAGMTGTDGVGDPGTWFPTGQEEAA